MVFTLRAQAASSYALTRLKDGNATSPSLGFANADSTGFYLESPGDGIGIVGGDGTATHPTLNFGNGKGVYATDSGLGLTGGGSLEGAVIQHHPSGRVWRSHSVLSGNYYNIIWVEELGLFVTANYDTGHVVTSKDGETWTASNVGVTARDIAWSPDLQLLVAVINDTVWTSPDAVTWTQQTAPAGVWESVTWAPSANAFVAIEQNGSTGTMTSPDGITWTLGPRLNARNYRIVANDTVILIIGNRVYRSVDGVSWSEYNPSVLFQDAAYSDTGVWVAVGIPGSIMSTDNGLTWTTTLGGGSGYSVAWCDGQFVANSTTTTSTSPDGVEWTTYPNVRPNKVWYGSAWSPTLQKVATVGWDTNELYTSDARTTLEIPGDLNVVGTLTSQTVRAGVTVTKIQITDNAWQAIDDTALDTATGGYIVVTGRDFSSGVVARVGPTTASSTVFISSTEIRIQLPAKAAGTYPLELVHSDGTVTTIPNAITYSPFPTWITDGSLAGTSANGMPFSFEIASSDSSLAVVTANATYPVGTTVATTPEGNTVAISGTITAPTTDTLYSFDATVEDAENQDLATKTWQLQHAATYHSQHLGNAVVQSFATASASATIDASSDTLTDTTGNVVAASTATGSTEITAASNILDGNASTVWTTAATYDPADGSYTGAVSTTVGGNAVLGEYVDLAFAAAQTITHLAIRPLDGSTAAVPVTFTVAGNSGGTWTLVHTQASALPLADGTETVVALDTPGSYSSYRVIAQTVGVGEDAAKIAGIRTWADGLPLLDYAHPITLVNGHVMARVGTTAVVIDPSSNAATTIAVSLTPTAKPALLPDASVFWPPSVGYTIGYRVATDGTVTPVTGIAADVSNAVLQADGTVLMLPSNGTTAQTYDPSSGAVANVTAYSLPGSEAVLEPAAVPGGVLALPNKAASGSLVQNGTVTTTTALFDANYNESKLVASDAEASAQFGFSVAVSGDGTRMVVGARFEDADGLVDAGAAYVYTLLNGSWVEDTKLVPENGSTTGATFGKSVSISSDGTRIAVCSSSNIYIFSLSNGSWVEDFTYQLSQTITMISISGNGRRVAISSANNYVSIFSDLDGTWTEEVVFSNPQEFSDFGINVSMSYDGTRVAIGAWKYNEDGNNSSGAVFVYTYVQNGSWDSGQKIVPNTSNDNARFGQQVSISNDGNKVCIGAYNYSDSSTYVFVFRNAVWEQEIRIQKNNSSFGTRLSMSGDGLTFISRNTDYFYIYSLINGTWVEEQTTISLGTPSISNDGSRVIVGDNLDDPDNLTDAGAVYTYDLSSAGQLMSSGNALVAKGSTVKTYDIDGDTVTSTIDLPATVSDLTVLDDGRVLATSSHTTAMTYDPATGTVTSVQGPRSLGRATRLLDGKVWTEGGVVFQSGSSVSTPLTATIGLSSFVNP